MSESAEKPLFIFTCLALILSTLLVFWQVRNFDFINYDDADYVVENPHVLHGLTPAGIIWAFKTGHASNWHPLTWLSLMLDCQLFGLNPGLSHLVSLLLHIANTLLLFTVLRKMTGDLWPSAFVAAAFALHPMHVQSVAWIAERKDVLSTLFLLLTLTAYVGYVRNRSLFRYLLTILLFALGLLAKPMLVTLPFVLLLLDYWPLNRFDVTQPVEISGRQSRKSAHKANKRTVHYKLIIEKIPFFVLAAISSVITFLIQRSSGATADIHALPLKARVCNAFLSYVKYMYKMFWPQNLAVFYPFDAAGIEFWQVALCALLLLIISFLVIRFGRNQKYLPVGWFWFMGTLMPVIGIVWVGGQALADRYTYIPYIGLFIMIAWGFPHLLSKLPYRRITLGISMLIVLTALGLCTYWQASYWNNCSAIFLRALDVTQNNYVAYFNLANNFLKQGDSASAIEYYLKALKIKPNYVYARNNLGLVLGKQGKLDEALSHFTQALQLMPDFADARNNLANVLILQGKLEEALDQLHTVLKLKPDSVDAHNNLGLVLQKQGKLNEAVVHFTQAVQINPDFVLARNNLANALILQGRFEEALNQLRIVLKLKPRQPDPMNNLAWLISVHPEIKTRDVNQAVRLAAGACELTGYKNSAYLETLAAAYAAAGRFPEAIDTAQKAVKIAEDANQPDIKNMLQYHLTFYTRSKPYTIPLPEPNKPR